MAAQRDPEAVAELRAWVEAAASREWSGAQVAEALRDLGAAPKSGFIHASELLIGPWLAARFEAEAMAELRAVAEAGDLFAQNEVAERGDAESVAELQRCVHGTYQGAANTLIALYRSSGASARLDLDVNANPREPTTVR